ncbi:TetR/AcrR family transcriptional regulator [Knoellia sp. S7-12]|uniref:TetR/AcrR family transcriptional regulator n=1 Tax=Knoellia sp. S7-12 TaxID=3126698 RepID=UPI003367FB06
MVSEHGSAPTGATRRERQRLQVLDEIKEAALGELRERGTAGVTMRAVARAIHITPSGLYRYVDGHEALLDLLAMDSLSDLADRIVAAQALADDGTHATRWFVGCLAMRFWSLEHPAEYGLIFDTQPAREQPRVAVGNDNPAFAAFSRVCAGALADREIDPDRTMLGSLGRSGEDNPAEVADLLAATGLACLIGRLSIEISGRIATPLTAEDRYPVFVQAVMRMLGFPEVSPGRAPVIFTA